MKKFLWMLTTLVIITGCQNIDASISKNKNGVIYNTHDLSAHFDAGKYRIYFENNNELVFKRFVNDDKGYYEEVYTYNINEDKIQFLFQIKEGEHIEPAYSNNGTLYFIRNEYLEKSNKTELLVYKNGELIPVLTQEYFVSEVLFIGEYDQELVMMIKSTDEQHNSILSIYNIETGNKTNYDYPSKSIISTEVYSDLIRIDTEDGSYEIINEELEFIDNEHKPSVHYLGDMIIYGDFFNKYSDDELRIVYNNEESYLTSSYILEILNDGIVVTNKVNQNSFFKLNYFCNSETIDCEMNGNNNDLSMTYIVEGDIVTKDVLINEADKNVIKNMDYGFKNKQDKLYFYNNSGKVVVIEITE